MKAVPKTRLETGIGSAFWHWKSMHFNALLNLFLISVALNSFFIVILWRLLTND